MFAHGLTRLPYWLTAFIFNLLLFALGMACLTIAGIVAQIEFFSQTALWLLALFYLVRRRRFAAPTTTVRRA